MRLGTLRHPSTIEAPTTTQDAHGEPTETWATFADVWASREDLSGRELFAAQQVKAEITTRFVARYVAGVTAKMRIRSDGVLYNIVSAADVDGAGRWLTLMAAREG